MTRYHFKVPIWACLDVLAALCAKPGCVAWVWAGGRGRVSRSGLKYAGGGASGHCAGTPLVHTATERQPLSSGLRLDASSDGLRECICLAMAIRKGWVAKL